MRQFIVVMLTLYLAFPPKGFVREHETPEQNHINQKDSKVEWLQWLAGLAKQGIDVSGNDWLILAHNPSPRQITTIIQKYARYLDQGALEKSLFQPGWTIQDTPEFDEGSKLTSQYLSSIEPAIPQYQPLKKALANLRGWQEKAATLFPDDLILFEDDQHQAVIHLNQWLEDLDLATALPEEAYSQLHKNVLTRVQLRFDLMPDGRLGAMTRQALLAINNERIRTLKANLERIRWLPKSLPYPHVRVDIAGLNVAYAVSQKEIYIHRAVIGTKAKQTPVFQDEIESITVNPVWKVPHGIAANSLLKVEKQKPGYFREEGFRVYESWDDHAQEVQPEAVNWHQYAPRTFHHRLEQKPGELNRLGKIKLNLPNEYGVYLHDTDKPELFDEVKRAYSSGCTRVEGIDLMVHRFAARQGLMSELVEKQLNPGTDKVILKEPIPIYFMYFTAWPDNSGRVRFREDIYQLDNALTSWF